MCYDSHIFQMCSLFFHSYCLYQYIVECARLLIMGMMNLVFLLQLLYLFPKFLAAVAIVGMS